MISTKIKEIIEEQGRTQLWVISKMNEANPKLNMDRVKFSAIVTNRRKMTGDELLAFCKATEINPDVFIS